MKKENFISVIVLVLLVVGLVYVISIRNKPSGEIIKNLTEPPKDDSGEIAGLPGDFTAPRPGDEKLVKKDIVLGTGLEAKMGDTLKVDYLGTLENGTKFDSSYDRKQPIEFILGAGQLIRGWEIGLLGMKVGGKRELTIPPELAYGEEGRPPVIPPDATLKFTIELLDAKNINEEVININPQ